MANDPSFFTWYELQTTDMAAAAAFYRDVLGWSPVPSSTSRMPYTLFMVGEVAAAGLLEWPAESVKRGARPRWMGYVGVPDVHAASDRVKRLGGSIYVPPTQANIGHISVVADPSAATFGLIDQQQVTVQQATDSSKPGRFGWNELYAVDLRNEVAFYRELFGWQKNDTEDTFAEAYVTLSAGGKVIAGAFTSNEDPPPFWLRYINVDDLDGAVERVKKAGGQAARNDDLQLPGGLSIAHCIDPQGAGFAIQGEKAYAPKVGWSTEWQGFSSRGQMVTPKPTRGSGDWVGKVSAPPQ